MKTRHCDECKHFAPRALRDYPLLRDCSVLCDKGHKLRFYKPKTYVDNTWGYKRKCEDFEPITTTPQPDPTLGDSSSGAAS